MAEVRWAGWRQNERMSRLHATPGYSVRVARGQRAGRLARSGPDLVGLVSRWLMWCRVVAVVVSACVVAGGLAFSWRRFSPCAGDPR